MLLLSIDYYSIVTDFDGFYLKTKMIVLSYMSHTKLKLFIFLLIVES